MIATHARIEPVDVFAELDTVFEIYCAALGAPSAARETQEWRDDVLPRHAARTDFDLLGARERAGGDLAASRTATRAPMGSGGRTAWHGAMDAATRTAWLDPPHFEVVELHVRPDRQRRGLGTRLLDTLLARQPHERALLTADPAAASALPFYEKHGWEPLADVELVPGAGIRIVLGRCVDSALPADQAANRSSSRPSRSSRQSSV